VRFVIESKFMEDKKYLVNFQIKIISHRRTIIVRAVCHLSDGPVTPE